MHTHIVSTYIYIYIYICIHAHAYIHIHVYSYFSLSLSLYIYIYIYVCLDYQSTPIPGQPLTELALQSRRSGEQLAPDLASNKVTIPLNVSIPKATMYSKGLGIRI